MVEGASWLGASAMFGPCRASGGKWEGWASVTQSKQEAQQKNLAAICDGGELGLMQLMASNRMRGVVFTGEG